MRQRLAQGLEWTALVTSCCTLAWGPLAQGGTLDWSLSGLALLGTLGSALTLLALALRGRLRANVAWLSVALLLLGWIWTSTIWANEVWPASRWAGVWTAVLGTGMSIHLLAQTRLRQAVVLGTLVLTLTVALAFAYLQTRGFSIEGFRHLEGAGTRFVTGPYFNPSHFSGFLIPGAALLTGLLLFTRPHLHTLALIGLLGTLHWLNLKTDSSSIPAAFLATGFPVLLLIWRKQRVVGALLGIITVAGLITLSVLFLTPQGQATFAQYQQRLGLSNSWSGFLEGRQAVWRYGLEMAQEHPFQGVGIGNFIAETPHYRLPPRETGSVVDQKLVNYAHNDGLQIAAELGWPALGLFTLLLLLPLVGRHWTRATYIWAAAMPALAFAGVYDGHLTAIPGTMVFAYALCGLAAVRPLPEPTAQNEALSRINLELSMGQK